MPHQRIPSPVVHTRQAEYGQRQYGSGSLSINNPGVGRNRILRTQAISGRSKSLTRGKINRHYHRSCHQLSPRANSVLPGDGGASGYQQVPPSTRGSSTTPPHSRPLFFSTALATTASDPISPPVSTEPTGSAFSTASGARPSQRAPGVPLNASGYEHEHGGDRLNGLHQQGRRVFSSVPSAEYHNELEFFSEQDEELLQALGQQAATALSLRDIHALCQSTSNEARILQARFLHREVRGFGVTSWQLQRYCYRYIIYVCYSISRNFFFVSLSGLLYVVCV